MLIFPIIVLFTLAVCLSVVIKQENKSFNKEIARLKKENWQLSQKIDSFNCGFDPIECEETHYPGQCPLCGGE